MRPTSSSAKKPAEQVVKDIRRQTRRHFSAEDKIRIVLEGLRGDDSIAELCRKEGIAQSLYYTWSKELMEAGKRRLAGDTVRAATSGEVQDLRREARALKECVADLTLDLALQASGCDSAQVAHKPRLLSDNGPSYIAGELADYIVAQRMSHVRGAPFHPQTQGKIERWHQTLKNRVLLENYFLPGDLEAQIAAFVEHYNHQRYHESLDNVTPADAYFGRASAIIQQRERIKRQTIEHRRLQHRKLAA